MITEKEMNDHCKGDPTMMRPLSPAELRRVERWLAACPEIAGMFSIPEIADRLQRAYGPPPAE
jgi:hypothetical protein